MHWKLIGWATLVVLVVAACGDGTSPATPSPGTDEAIATFETADGERYRLVLSGEHLERARLALESGESAGIPNGRIQAGDGGINTGKGWHVVDVELVDMTIELCDATVSYIDELGYEGFVSEHGDRFCPWGAILISLDIA